MDGPGAPIGAISVFVMSLLLSLQAGAGEPSCADVVEAHARLACYDARHPPGEAVRAAAAARAVEQFGRDAWRERVAGTTPAPDRLEATVVAVMRQSGDLRRVELDSGQHWLITEATTRGPLHRGDRIGLRKAALGSYMLITPAGVPLRARRIR